MAKGKGQSERGLATANATNAREKKMLLLKFHLHSKCRRAESRGKLDIVLRTAYLDFLLRSD